MSEATTGNLNDGRSFEERVFARFDSLDARFDSLDKRVEALETQGKNRALDTKPIWERALAEIGGLSTQLRELKSELGDVKFELSEVKKELGEVKKELNEVKDRVTALEDATTLMGRKIEILNQDLTTLRAKQYGQELRIEKLESKNPS